MSSPNSAGLPAGPSKPPARNLEQLQGTWIINSESDVKDSDSGSDDEDTRDQKEERDMHTSLNTGNLRLTLINSTRILRKPSPKV